MDKIYPAGYNISSMYLVCPFSTRVKLSPLSDFNFYCTYKHTKNTMFPDCECKKTGECPHLDIEIYFKDKDTDTMSARFVDK